MNTEELENILAICYDEIVYKIGNICIANIDKDWYLVSLVNGQIIDSNIHSYKTIKQGFMIIEGTLDRDARKYDYAGTKFIYSVKQDKLWDLPYQSEMYLENNLLVFIADSDDVVDIAVFNSITGSLIDRIQVNRPSSLFKTSSNITKTGKYTELLVKVTNRRAYEEENFSSNWRSMNYSWETETRYRVYDSIEVEVEYRLKFGKIKFKLARAKELYRK